MRRARAPGSSRTGNGEGACWRDVSAANHRIFPQISELAAQTNRPFPPNFARTFCQICGSLNLREKLRGSSRSQSSSTRRTARRASKSRPDRSRIAKTMLGSEFRLQVVPAAPERLKVKRYADSQTAGLYLVWCRFDQTRFCLDTAIMVCSAWPGFADLIFHLCHMGPNSDRNSR